MSLTTRRLSLGLALLLLGCQPVSGPTGVKAPKTSKVPIETQASPSPGVVPSTPGVLAPSIAPGTPVIGNNGANLAGVVKAPASLVSNNGGSYRIQATVEQVVVVGAAVVLKDAAGKVVAETKTGADGRYGFSAALPTENLILEVALPAQKGTVQAIVPKEGTGPKTVDADLMSTLTTGYILSQYVKGDPKVLDKLPAAVEQETRQKAQSAFAGGTAAVPEALTESKVVAVVDQLRQQDPAFNTQMEAVKKLLVVGASAAITDGPALEALLYEPQGLVYGPDGQLYIADSLNALIRKLSPEGRIATVAGTGALETKDGPIATAALRQPMGLGFDQAGNLYVGEPYAIRKITPGGVVSTLAGSTRQTRKDGKGDQATFYDIVEIAVTPDGTVYVKDLDQIRRVTADGTVTSLGFNADSLATDKAGNLYAGGGGYTIKKIAPDGTSSLITIKEPGVWPYTMTIGPTGTVYVANFSRAARLTPDGTSVVLADQLTTYTDPKAGEFKIGDIAGMAVDAAGNLYTSSTLNHRVYKVTPEGVVTVAAGSGKARQKDGEGGDVLFNHPFSVAIAKDGQTLVADTYNHTVRQIDAAGKVTLVAGTGQEGHADGPGASATFIKPNGLLVDEQGVIYVSEVGRIRKIALDGTVSTLSSDAEIGVAAGMAFDAQKNLIVTRCGADGMPDREIVKVTPAGVVSKVVTFKREEPTDGQLAGPRDVLVEPDGSLLVTDFEHHQIRKVAPDGTLSTYAGALTSGDADGPIASARFNKPIGLARGADGSVYVADMWNHKIRRIKDGMVTTLPITGLNYPTELTFAPDGRLVVADGGNSQVKFFDPPN